MLQFDIVLQKQHLGDHREVHPAMYMPSHGEFLVEQLARCGLKPGLSFGLDDFAEGAHLLNQSSSEILIVCGADQHLSEAFYAGWALVRRNYAYVVLIVSEPIFSPLAFYADPVRNAISQHVRFLETVSPQRVLYLTPGDLLASEQAYGTAFTRQLYSLADPALMTRPVTPWPAKDPVLLYLGKPQAWIWARRPVGALTRAAQLEWFMRQSRHPFAWSERKFSFRQCYEVADQFRYQLQPRSGYAFHTARTVQSAIVGSIPVILLHRDELPLLRAEAPYAEPDGNLLVGLEGEFDALIDKLHDEDLVLKIHTRLSELLAAGTISQGAATLVQAIQTTLGESDLS